MSEFTDIPSFDSRSREAKDGEYTIDSVTPGCKIVCCRPGMKLVDFYRTSPILFKDLPPKPIEKETP